MKTSMKSIKIKDLAQISGASVQEVEMALKKTLPSNSTTDF